MLTIKVNHLYCFGNLAADMFFSKNIVVLTISCFFALALMCEGTTEGETSHSILNCHMAKLSLF
jgi:hypothetical protein